MLQNIKSMESPINIIELDENNKGYRTINNYWVARKKSMFDDINKYMSSPLSEVTDLQKSRTPLSKGSFQTV